MSMSSAIIRKSKIILSFLLATAFLTPAVNPADAADTLTISGTVQYNSSGLAQTALTYTSTDTAINPDNTNPENLGIFTYFGSLVNADSSPIQGMTIYFGSDIKYSKATDSNGRFPLDGYVIKQSARLTDYQISFTNQPAAWSGGFSLSGTITSEGNPVADAIVQFGQDSNIQQLAPTDAAGNFVFSATVNNIDNMDTGDRLTLGQASVWTDGSGGYTIYSLPAGSYTVIPSKPGFMFTPPSLSYPNMSLSQTLQDYTAALAVTISGSTGVAGVALRYDDGGTKTVLSQVPTGAYSITVPQGWTGTVIPSKAGYKFTPDQIIYGTPIDADTPNQNYAPTKLFTIQGNAGVGGAQLHYIVDGTPQTTDAAVDGNFTVTVPDGWAGILQPQKVGYIFTPPYRDYATTPVTTDLTGQDFTAIGSISGNITYHGQPLPGVTVSGGGDTTQTDANGHYTLTVLPGAYTLLTSKAGYNFTPDSPSVDASSSSIIQDFAASGIYNISGDITYHAHALSGVTVRINAGADTVQTGNDGHYSIDVPPNSYTLTPSKTGYDFSPISVVADATSGSVAQNFTASGKYTISGKVAYFGTGLEGVTVQAASTIYGNFSVTTASDGTYTISNLGNDIYALSSSLNGYNVSAEFINPVTISGSSVGGKDFTATGFYSIRGRITTQDGNPVQGINVSVGVKSGITDADGSYTISGLGPRSYTVTPSLDSGYTFHPVSLFASIANANVLGQDFTALLPTEAKDANLQTLAPDLGYFSWSFSSGLTTYNMSLANRFDTLTITAKTEQSLASLRVALNGSTVPPVGDTYNLHLNVVSMNQAVFAVTSHDGTVTRSYTININNLTTNNPLRFVTSQKTSAIVRTVYTYLIKAQDDYHDLPTYTSTPLPAWLHLTDNGDGTATLSGMPAFSDVGMSKTIVITASDSHSLSEVQVFTIQVVGPYSVFLPIAYQ
jgi:hypothetical protein